MLIVTLGVMNWLRLLNLKEISLLLWVYHIDFGPSNLEIAKKSYEISSKVVDKEIDRLEQAYRAERLRKLENIPSSEKKRY